jgi:hypothetical protein
MNKKIICICLIALVTLGSLSTLMMTNKVNAGDPLEQVSGMLPYDYMWFNITENLSNVIFNRQIYPADQDIVRKGRAFGSVGDVWTANFLFDEMANKSHLENVAKLPLGPIKTNQNPEPYEDWYYTSLLDINDFSLTINDDDYPYPNPVPKNETFAFASQRPNNIAGTDGYNSITYTREFDHVRVIEKNISWLYEMYGDSLGMFGGQYTGVYLNVTNCISLTEFYEVIANVVYVSTREDLPVDQEGTLFIVNEEESCQTIIDNVTSNASGILLIHNSSKSSYNANIENVSVCVARTTSDEQNLTDVIELLQDDTFIIADNINDNETITFQYDFEDINDPAWSQDHVYLTWLPTRDQDYFAFPFFQHLAGATILQWLLNKWLHQIFTGYCYGFILYDAVPDTHYMDLSSNGWVGFSSTNHNLSLLKNDLWGVPMFSVNYSVGNRILEHCEDGITISGFIDQEYIEEKHPDTGEWTAGVEAYNVEGNITIPHSPDDAIVILSNRRDGWYSQASGDSACGAGVVLGIAKYMTDNHIQPRYNLTFLMTTGEEYGFRGAWHYSHNRSESNIIRWIGTDQLAFTQEGASFTLEALCNHNDTEGKIIWEIIKQSGYTLTTGNEFQNYESEPTLLNQGLGGTEDVVWRVRPNCNSIVFHKSGNWIGHHKTGINYTEGDAMNYMDRNDANASLRAIWDVVKYFCVNPDCRFNNVVFTAFDSPNDGDTLYDSIRTNFTIHSILPSDQVRVELELAYEVNGEGGYVQNAGRTDYTITSGIQNCSYTFTIPDDVVEGNYSVSFKLYNSTGRINRIVFGQNDSYYNDSTETSEWYPLYHPLGYVKIGDTYKCVNGNISGSIFTANENGRAENITAYINQNFNYPGPYTCMLYRANDSTLIGVTTDDWVSLPRPPGEEYLTSWWAVFNFSGNKPVLIKGVQYLITCWGGSAYSRVYYDESVSSETGRYYSYPYGDPPDQGDFTNEQRYYSMYCGYTADNTPPQITDVTASPNTVGFGYNVTINANVTDAGSGVELVTVEIDHGYMSSNSTMSHISGDRYQYIFTDTWLARQYNYTIWAVDNATNINSSSEHHFHVSADATISIATLKDSYSGSDFIDITDPPSPPENYTLIGRGLDWDNYYDTVSGQNILEVSAGPANYQNETNVWTPINSTFQQLTGDNPVYAYGYRMGNDHGLFGAYFKPDAQSDWPVVFAYNRSDDPISHAVRSKLVGVGYVDPQSNWAYQYLQNVQSSQGQINDDAVTYPGVFTGTDVTWSYGNTELKEAITLRNATKTMLQNHMPSQYGLNDASSYLVFISKLDYQNLNIYNVLGVLNGNVTISDVGVDFKDALGQFKCALPLGEVYELNNNSIRQKLTYRLVHLNGDTYLLSGLKVSDLNAMTFPVVIDPTLTVDSLTNDGYIYKTNSNYNTAWTASTGTISSSDNYISIGQNKVASLPPDYRIYRGFVLFNTSSLPSNAVIDNAKLSLYKKDDYSTTDFAITIQNGQPVYPHNPLQTGDYVKSHYSGNGGSLNTMYFVNGRNDFGLTNLSWINRTGITKLCLRSSRDISGTTPTGSEYVNVYSADTMDSHGESYKPRLIITYRNQSKIKNTGSTDIKGYLLIQIQFYNTSQGVWVVDNDTINETSPRTITSNSQLALDTIFNGLIHASDLTHGAGTYRVYAAFRDPEGKILRTDDGTELVTWWQFSLT